MSEQMPELDALGYDDNARYVGPCATCGTDHRHTCGPGTLQGDWECNRAQLAALGDHPLLDALLAELDASWGEIRAAMTAATFTTVRDALQPLRDSTR
jgi:hypothetical protein